MSACDPGNHGIVDELDPELGVIRRAGASGPRVAEFGLAQMTHDGPAPSGLRYCINALSLTKDGAAPGASR